VGAINSVILTDAQGVVPLYPDETNKVDTSPYTLTLGGVINDISSLNSGDQVVISTNTVNGNRLNFGVFQTASALKDSNNVTIFDVTTSGSVLTRSVTLTRTANSPDLGGVFNFTLNIRLAATGTGVYNCIDGDTVQFVIAGVNYKYLAVPMNPTKNTNLIDYRTYTTFQEANSLHFNTGIYWGALYRQILVNDFDTTLINTSDAKYNNDIILITKVVFDHPTNIIEGSVSQSDAGAWAAIVKDDSKDLWSVTNVGGVVNGALTLKSLGAGLTQAEIEAQLPAYHKAVVSEADGSYTVAVNLGKVVDSVHTNLHYSNSANSSSSSFCNYRSSEATNKLIDKARTADLMALLIRTGVAMSLADPSLVTEFSATILANDYFPVRTFSGKNYPVSNSADGQSRVVVHYVDQGGHAVYTVASSWGWPDPNGANATPSPAYTASPESITNYQLITDADLLNNFVQSDFAIANSIASADVISAATDFDYPTTSGSQLDVYFVYQRLYEVSFENNEADTIGPDSQSVIENDAAEEPVAPARAGYVFGGWYRDEELTEPYDFSSLVTGDIVLYAKWSTACQYDNTIADTDVACKDPNPPGLISDKDPIYSGLVPTPPDAGQQVVGSALWVLVILCGLIWSMVLVRVVAGRYL
jgi:uncharacterized repeat protein (TIGR02543 family)